MGRQARADECLAPRAGLQAGPCRQSPLTALLSGFLVTACVVCAHTCFCVWFPGIRVVSRSSPCVYMPVCRFPVCLCVWHTRVAWVYPRGVFRAYFLVCECAGVEVRDAAGVRGTLWGPVLR